MLCSGALMLVPLSPLCSQDPARTPRVKVDRHSGAFGTALPFDEPFIFVGRATDGLLRIDLTYARSAQLPRSRCDSLGTVASAPNDSLRRSTWQRIAAAADSFWLEVEALEANVDYTFCFTSVEALSAVDSAAFQQRAIAALRFALRGPMAEREETPVTEAGLAAFRRALIASLPKAERVEIKPGTIFDSSASLDIVRDAFVGFAAYDNARLDAAREIDRQRDPDLQNALANLIVRLGADSAIWRVPVVSVDGLATGPDRARLAAAAQLGRTLFRVSPNNAATIAVGQTPITHPRPPTEGNANVTRRWSPSEVIPWAENMDLTLDRLRDLTELLVALRAEPAPATRAAIQREDLERLHSLVDRVRIAAATQRSSLRQLIEGVAGMDTAIVVTVRTVVARDLIHVGFPMTTAATYETRARWHVSQDLGVLYATRANAREMSPYFGLNFYLRPVNKRAPLRGLSPSRRLSVTLGVTTQNLKEEDEYAGVISGKALVMGAGVRVADFFRVSYLAPLVYTYSGPEDDRDRHVAAFHAVAVSIDAELREIISGVANALFPK